MPHPSEIDMRRLLWRVSLLRSDFLAVCERSTRTREAIQATSGDLRRARRARWEGRYELARARHERKLGPSVFGD
jgi:hypothetical protein